MDAYGIILTRRSIRKYTTQSISEETLHDLIRATVSAPFAGNQQPWHFLIIDEKKLLQKIPEYHPNGKMLKFADKAILICGDLNRETFKGYWMIDCSAATQNLLLAAHTYGIGSCWLGVYPVDERVRHLRKLFGIPEHVIPFSLVALGYPDESKKSENRYNSTRIHRNRW
jgi:nitroreductase